MLLVVAEVNYFPQQYKFTVVTKCIIPYAEQNDKMPSSRMMFGPVAISVRKCTI